MVFTYLRSYFRETTVHGFRYVAEGNSCLERFTWIFCIFVSFTFAGILLKSNLKDTSENPISTSVTTIPVQDINFPAVTVQAPYLPHAKRLFEHNLNTILFDCSRVSHDDYYRACINSTLWHDLQPLLTEAVTDKANNAIQVFKKILKSQPILDSQHPVTNFVCQKFIRTSMDFVLRNIAFGLAEAYNSSTHSERRVWVPNVYKNIAEMFRRYFIDDSTYMATILLKDYYYQKDYLESERLRDCNKIAASGNFSSEAVAFAASVINALGMTDYLYALKLGQFLTIGTTSIKNAKHQKMDEQQAEIYNKISNLLPIIISKNTTISANQAYYYLALDSGYPEITTNTKIECNMRAFIYLFTMKQPCVIDVNSTCCLFEKTISENIDIVFRLMKYVIAPSVIPVREKTEKSAVTLLSKHAKYMLKPQEPSNTQPCIVACKYGNQKLTNKCSLFSRLYSTFGISYTFNNAPFFELLQNNSHNYAFYKEIYEQVNDRYSFENQLPRKTLDYGKPYSLEMYISHLPFEKTASSFRKAVSFRRPLLKIHDPLVLPDIRNNEVELEPGVQYDISAIPSLTITDQAGLTLSEAQRNCRLRTEDGHLEVFKGYSKPSCFFECKLRQASKLCKCIPWDYPRLSGVSLCRLKAASDCFEGAMSLRVNSSECNCPNDCAHTQYALMPIIKPLSPSAFCDTSKSIIQGAFKINKFFSTYNLLNGGGDKQVPCEELVSRISVVRVSIPSITANLVVRTRRVTFAGQLANLGGIIGLFSGMSILSLAEIAYWFLKSVMTPIFGNKKTTIKKALK